MSPKKKRSTLSKNSRIQDRAVMTRDGKKAQEYANRHGIIKYYDADAFINDPDIDATYEALKNKEVPCL
jgi:predicted dehydrogenase